MLDRNITGVGTIKNNRRCIPKEINSTANRENYSYKCYWEKENKKISLHSYVVNTKSSGKKNVLALSSMPPILGITKDDKHKKPAVLKFYDFSKVGTDVIDQRMGSYTVNTKSRRWTMSSFSYILDTIRVNSQTIYSLNNGMDPRKVNSFKFGWELAKELVKPFIELRRNETKNLKSHILKKINYILGEPVIAANSTAQKDILPKQPQVKKRCHFCIENIKGPGYNEMRDKLAKKNIQCQKCGRVICNDHSIIVCNECN